MVERHVPLLFFAVFKQGEVDDPQETELVLADEIVPVSQIKAHPPHDLIYLGPLVSHDEEHVPSPKTAQNVERRRLRSHSSI